MFADKVKGTVSTVQRYITVKFKELLFMKMKYILLALLASVAIAGCDQKSSSSSATPAGTESAKAEYNYIEPDAAAKAIRDKDAYSIVDIQLKENFDKQHLTGAIPTYAFPAKDDEQKARLKEALTNVPEKNKIIVVCPRGGSGAKNTVDYYRSLGVDNNRLLILKGGEEGFPAEKLSDVVTSNK